MFFRDKMLPDADVSPDVSWLTSPDKYFGTTSLFFLLLLQYSKMTFDVFKKVCLEDKISNYSIIGLLIKVSMENKCQSRCFDVDNVIFEIECQ